MATRHMTMEVTGPVSWAAVAGGVFVALIVHILLNMLGAGIGAASIDVTPAEGEAQTIGWGAFAWWSISGIIAAFAGGWAAGLLSSGYGSRDGGIHGFLSWAVTTVIVVASSALAAGTAAAAISALFAPLATFPLASVLALLIGAAAATWAGDRAGTRTTSRGGRK
jgi:hypothetical protein